MTERQKFTVQQKYEGFELRVYEPCVLAEVKVNGSLERATNQAFGALFNYIAKGNTKAEKIAMTAPVTAVGQDGPTGSSWVVSFVMPAGSKLEDMPSPSNSNVQLRGIPSELCAVLSFRGRADADRWTEKESTLRKLATLAGLKLSHEVRVHRFDPPFKPGFMHYNEVAIPVLHE
jgi:hypothetical protein